MTNLSDDCVVSREENSVWKMYKFKEQSLQAQGWQINISATLDNAEQILQKVSNILVERKVHFKHLASGPYILSDKCWKNSNVYYRYGGFAMIFNEQGELCIKDENGELLVDERVPYYHFFC